MLASRRASTRRFIPIANERASTMHTTINANWPNRGAAEADFHASTVASIAKGSAKTL